MKTPARSFPALLQGPRLQQMMLSISRQAERDIAEFITCRRENYIHALRVRMKKLRALLGLVESGAGAAAMEAIRRGVRAIRLAFAPVRDQQVLQSLLAELSPRGAAVSAGARLTAVRPPGPRKLRELEAVARELTVRLQRLKLNTLTREDVAAAFAGNYAEAQRRHQRCRRKPSPKRMHHWRTFVKDHYFQSLILLRDRHRCKPARKLASLLGSLHDLTLLREQTGEDISGDLHHGIRRRMKELRRRAFRTARRLFARAPAKVSRRMLKVARARTAS